MDDYPEPAPPKPATPVPRIDANARRDNARIAVQYAEERTSHVQWQRNGSAMQVESTDFPIQNVELMQSNSIQAAYTPVLTPTQCSEDLALRRSNVDGNFYSHEFDREEMVEVTDEERSQKRSVIGRGPWHLTASAGPIDRLAHRVWGCARHFPQPPN